MKRFISRAVAVILTCVLAFSSAVCFAADSTESADAKKYYDYGTYVLLGDSVASGHNDLVYVDSEFKRVENSYGAYVADALGVNYVPMACPGFRTIDIRYMLEDDYPGDDYLFHDSHNPEVMKSRIPEYRRAISQAGLITLGVGGNDFGTYLTWVIADILEKEGTCSKYVKALRDLLKENGIVNDKLDKIVELAKITDAMPELIRVLPRALKYGVENFFENWNHVIEDIYALNPDVQLLVIGMFDTSVKSDAGATDTEESKDDSQSINLGQMVVDIANKPMKEGAEKYGYIFVDTTGTTCDTYHPTAAGHRHIADRILDALPVYGCRVRFGVLRCNRVHVQKRLHGRHFRDAVQPRFRADKGSSCSGSLRHGRLARGQYRQSFVCRSRQLESRVQSRGVGCQQRNSQSVRRQI